MASDEALGAMDPQDKRGDGTGTATSKRQFRDGERTGPVFWWTKSHNTGLTPVVHEEQSGILTRRAKNRSR